MVRKLERQSKERYFNEGPIIQWWERVQRELRGEASCRRITESCLRPPSH